MTDSLFSRMRRVLSIMSVETGIDSKVVYRGQYPNAVTEEDDDSTVKVKLAASTVIGCIDTAEKANYYLNRFDSSESNSVVTGLRRLRETGEGSYVIINAPAFPNLSITQNFESLMRISLYLQKLAWHGAISNQFMIAGSPAFLQSVIIMPTEDYEKVTKTGFVEKVTHHRNAQLSYCMEVN